MIVVVLTGGPLAPDSTYELAEFTFHWGKEDDRGSEHTVNGKAYPMEVGLIVRLESESMSQ